MKTLTNKILRICSLLVLAFGIFSGTSYAETSDVIIDTNGNIEINDSTNTVTITANGNNPLIVNNVNLPGNQNLVINGDFQNQPLISFDRGNSNPGPVINLVPSYNQPQLLETHSIQIPQGLQPVKSETPVSNSTKFPIIVELEKPHTVKEPETFVTVDRQRPSTGASISMTSSVTNSLAAATGSLSDPVYINIESVHEATAMASNATGEIVLQ